MRNESARVRIREVAVGNHSARMGIRKISVGNHSAHRADSFGTNIESLRESLKRDESVVDSTSDSLKDSDSLVAQKQKTLQDLLEAGVYPELSPGLVEEFPEEKIRPWLDLYPTARSAGVAKSPGWIVSALRNNHPMDLVLVQIDRKLANHQRSRFCRMTSSRICARSDGPTHSW